MHMGTHLYFLGFALVAAAILWGKLRSRTIIDHNSGNIIVSDATGHVSQTSFSPAVGDSKASSPDRVAWAIGIAGVVIALAQLVNDLAHAAKQ